MSDISFQNGLVPEFHPVANARPPVWSGRRVGGAGAMMTAQALLLFFLMTFSAPAAVRVFIESSNSVALVKYECTAGEVIRGFALDVTVDKGSILGISNYFKGISTVGNTGYGIFPSSYRDHIVVSSNGSVNWNVAGYDPMAVPGESGAKAGLGSSGVTLEFGGLWDLATPAAIPAASGILCALAISETATVSISANSPRGGVVSANPAVVLSPTFTSAVVNPSPSYASWIGGYNVGTQTGFNDDSDGDRIPNGMEAFFGTNPGVSNTGLTKISLAANIINFQHPNPNLPVSDVTGSYKWSPDLNTWYAADGVAGDGNTTVTAVATANNPAANTTTVIATIGGAVPSKIFMRVVATKP